MIEEAGWYVKNEVIARDLKVETFEKFVKILPRRAFNRTDAGPYTSQHNLASHYDRPTKGYQLPRDLISKSPNEGKQGVEDPQRRLIHHTVADTQGGRTCGSDAPDNLCSRECDRFREYLRQIVMPSRSRPTPTGANAGRPGCGTAAATDVLTKRIDTAAHLARRTLNAANAVRCLDLRSAAYAA
ncbi:hypothetical protein EVAR_96492_1 [Eumeta japonica]|uniref:Uncharacterized protein n=1 Tax=Eumeta variegata TaxID=151549 RepID=A0A4C1ZV03_EUMVA|nr:hypothetical protein EVAR_96492_1 [Eumeta japonica]